MIIEIKLQVVKETHKPANFLFSLFKQYLLKNYQIWNLSRTGTWETKFHWFPWDIAENHL